MNTRNLFISLWISGLSLGIFHTAKASDGGDFPRSTWPRGVYAESELSTANNQAILPFFRTGVTGTFLTYDRLTLSYLKFEHPNERAAVVLVPGRGESYSTFPEVIYALYQNGYSVWALDQRSQGHSQRILKNPRKTHVQEFDDYVRDLNLFVKGFVKNKKHPRVFALGNSMGGLVVALAAERDPSLFDAAVLISPLLEVNRKGIPEPVAYTIAYAAMGTGHGKNFCLYQHDATPVEVILSDGGMGVKILVRDQGKMKTRKPKYFPEVLSGPATLTNPKPEFGQGLGLGLSIVKAVTEAMGAEFSIATHPTRFLIQLPESA